MQNFWTSILQIDEVLLLPCSNICLCHLVCAAESAACHSKPLGTLPSVYIWQISSQLRSQRRQSTRASAKLVLLKADMYTTGAVCYFRNGRSGARDQRGEMVVGRRTARRSGQLHRLSLQAPWKPHPLSQRGAGELSCCLRRKTSVQHT
jgi:hypothetical protein